MNKKIIMIFLTLTDCKRSKSMALTPVLSKSRFSNSERNSGTFKSLILRDSNDSDMVYYNKQITTNDKFNIEMYRQIDNEIQF